MPTVGHRLRVTRLRRRLTQTELAKASGVPVVTISRIENDTHEQHPRFSTIDKLADALKVDPAWLQFGNEEETATPE